MMIVRTVYILSHYYVVHGIRLYKYMPLLFFFLHFFGIYFSSSSSLPRLLVLLAFFLRCGMHIELKTRPSLIAVRAYLLTESHVLGSAFDVIGWARTVAVIACVR